MPMTSTTNNSGKISVLMGIRNCAATLPAAIDSIIAQTYENWELIMCDDASSDETYNVAMGYACLYPDKMKVLKNETNRYLAYSLNKCLQLAEGEYIARMDGDDLSAPERFERQIAFLQAHPDIDLVGTAMQRFSDDGGLADVAAKPERPDRYTLRNTIPFNHATILTYKRVYDALGGYTVCKRTNRAQDYDLWFRFYAEGFSGANLQDALYFVREDLAAIKRRTLSVRMNALKTTYIGYSLLGYPKHWLVRPTLSAIGKSLIPSKAMLTYRNYQKRRVAR